MSVRFPVPAFALGVFAARLCLAADCQSPVTVQVPPTACKSGTATAAVALVAGATYAWTVEGGEITGPADGNQIAIALGASASATASVTVTGNCVAHGNGVIALHDPLGVHATIPAAYAGIPLTISWSYEHGTPAQQSISGSDFGTVALAPAVRSYTYVPAAGGSKQVVIEAALAPASTTSRRRAVATTPPITASPCASVHVTSTYVVGDCQPPVLQVFAPTSVVAGSTFDLSILPQSGADATWTIGNATPATASGNSVHVVAGSAGNVAFTVYLTRNGCEATFAGSIPITEKPACSNPTALVSVARTDCGQATIRAILTGTPPFSGTWSDGVSFSTLSAATERIVTTPGSYSITSFQDAVCSGTSSGTATLASLRPTATVTGNVNSCVGQDKFTAHFTGVPPFTGLWADGAPFTTSQTEVVRDVTSVAGTLASMRDATNCDALITNFVAVHPSPTIALQKVCMSTLVSLDAQFGGVYTSPFTVTWSDGTVLTGSQSQLSRIEAPTGTTTYSITSAADRYCSAIPLGVQSITPHAPLPLPLFNVTPPAACVGQILTATLSAPLPAGSSVSWFARNATIVGGQGTSSVQFKSLVPTTAQIECTVMTSDPNDCPTTLVEGIGIADSSGTISVSPTTIHAGQSAVITYVVHSSQNWTLSSSLNDAILPDSCAVENTCHATYVSSQGPGTASIDLHLTAWCGTKSTVSVPLTILP